MNLSEQLIKFIDSEKLFSKKDHLLIAVSGGVDSIVLCDLCFKAGFNFSIAHCNFQLRDEESEKDAALAERIAGVYKVKFYQKKFETNTYSLNHKVSIQVAARELRYEWFDELLENKNDSLKKLLTAHHADDNIETILMNLSKGSGIDGLRGILPLRGKICRPLLFATKLQLTEYAKKNNLEWREDASNSSDKYTRNYFRHQVIPLLENSLPGFSKNMLENSSRFRDIEILYDQSVKRTLKKLIKEVNDDIHVPVEAIKNLPARETILYELVKNYGFNSSQLPFIIQLLYSESGRFVESKSHRILRSRKWLIINPQKTDYQDNIIVSGLDEDIKLPGFNLKFLEVKVPASLKVDPSVALLDKEKIKFPLIIRRWKQGDYFYPLGMKKKKKLSRFFIDIKLSISEKENVWVIESDKKIIWIAGQRIDDRFKITSNTKSALKISLIAE